MKGNNKWTTFFAKIQIEEDEWGDAEIADIFGSVKELKKCKCPSVRLSVRLFDENLSRAFNLHLSLSGQS